MVDKLGFDKSEEKRMFLQAKLRTAKKEALLGGWGGEVCTLYVFSLN